MICAGALLGFVFLFALPLGVPIYGGADWPEALRFMLIVWLLYFAAGILAVAVVWLAQNAP